MTVYYPLATYDTNDNLYYQAIPYSVMGSLQCRKGIRQKVEFFSQCSLTEKGCRKKIEKLKAWKQ